MNIEFEVKDILRSGFNEKMKIKNIQKFTNFSKNKIQEALNSGFPKVSDKYWIMIQC